MAVNAKRLIELCLIIILAVTVSGCRGASKDHSENDGPSTDAEVVGTIAHGVRNPVLAKDGSGAIYNYDGGDIELEYSATASGAGKNVGFLLFLDGIPQPYRIGKEEETEYMHMFSFEEDNIENQFSFVFTPIIGTAGETLKLRIYSVFYPQFQPDMEATFGYGIYHSVLEASINVRFCADVPESEMYDNGMAVSVVSSVAVTVDDLTDDFIRQCFSSSLEMDTQTVEALLKSRAFSFISYDGETQHSSIDISNRKEMRITYQMVGAPNTSYRISLFANHKPISDGKNITWEMKLAEGKVITIEITMTVSTLNDFTTFYVFACPIESGDPKIYLVGEKTASVLLYKNDV